MKKVLLGLSLLLLSQMGFAATSNHDLPTIEEMALLIQEKKELEQKLLTPDTSEILDVARKYAELCCFISSVNIDRALRKLDRAEVEYYDSLVDSNAESEPEEESSAEEESESDGSTQLHTCAEKNDTSSMIELLRSKADIKIRDKNGRTPLMRACMNGSTASVLQILDHIRKNESRDAIALRDYISCSDNTGWTAILYSADNPDYFNSFGRLLMDAQYRK